MSNEIKRKEGDSCMSDKLTKGNSEGPYLSEYSMAAQVKMGRIYEPDLCGKIEDAVRKASRLSCVWMTIDPGSTDPDGWLFNRNSLRWYYYVDDERQDFGKGSKLDPDAKKTALDGLPERHPHRANLTVKPLRDFILNSTTENDFAKMISRIAYGNHSA